MERCVIVFGTCVIFEPFGLLGKKKREAALNFWHVLHEKIIIGELLAA